MADERLNSGFYRFKIGRFDCIAVSDGTFDYNPMHLFPDLTEEQIRSVLRDHNVNPDKIISPYTFLFVDTGKNKVLCDMGAGKLGPDTGKLLENPEDRPVFSRKRLTPFLSRMLILIILGEHLIMKATPTTPMPGI